MLPPIVNRIEEINQAIANGTLQPGPDLEQALLDLEILREQLNQFRREAEGAIRGTRAELQEATNAAQLERLA